jgi:hypothetical protein
MLSSVLQPHSLRAWEDSGARTGWRLRVDLGSVGRCPDRPDLIIHISDGSGSITAPGGKDPIGNRWEEAQIAFDRLKRCRCGRCLGGVVHFDTPAGGIEPGPLGDRAFQRKLRTALRDPVDGFGVSLIGPSLLKAEQIAHAHTGHSARLVILTDWELFDTFDYIDRIRKFPGSVLAVGLGATPPSALETETVTSLRIDHADPPGTVARAVFGALISNRVGATQH